MPHATHPYKVPGVGDGRPREGRGSEDLLPCHASLVPTARWGPPQSILGGGVQRRDVKKTTFLLFLRILKCTR